MNETDQDRTEKTVVRIVECAAVIGLAIHIVMPRIGHGNAKAMSAKFEIGTMRDALDAFMADTGRYPTTAEGLLALVESPADANGWKGPYLSKGLHTDPWSNPYVYRRPGAHNTAGFDLLSFGPDGYEGGGDDVDNWTTN